jgi:hypothetical protein
MTPRCGVCDEHYGDLLVRHGEVCDDDRKAKAKPYAPEIDDLIKMIEEGEGNA